MTTSGRYFDLVREMKDAYNHRLRLVESARQRGIKPTARLFATTIPSRANGLAAEVRDEPEEEGERGAEEQTGDDWKVKSSMFAAVKDVAGQFSQAEWELVSEIEKSSEEDEESTEEKKRAAELAKGVHEVILRGPSKSFNQSLLLLLNIYH